MARKSRGGGRRRGLTQNTTYVIERVREDLLANTDPAVGTPQVNSSDFTFLNVYLSTPYNDGVTLENCRNFGIQFNDSLGKMSSVNEFVNLFQYYKVLKITRTFTPLYGPGATATTGYGFTTDTSPLTASHTTATIGWPTPSLQYTWDGDSSLPIQATAAYETQGVRRRKMGSTFTHSFRPNVATVTPNSTDGPSLFGGAKRAPWINTDTTSVSLYGFRYGILDWPGPNNGVGAEGDEVPCAWRITTRYKIAFKGVQ